VTGNQLSLPHVAKKSIKKNKKLKTKKNRRAEEQVQNRVRERQSRGYQESTVERICEKDRLLAWSEK